MEGSEYWCNKKWWKLKYQAQEFLLFKLIRKLLDFQVNLDRKMMSN